MKKLLVVLFVCALLVGVFFLIQAKKAVAPQVGDTTGSASTTSAELRNVMTIEEYITANISNISPMPAVLGGKLYVTNIEAHGGAGTVSYEDGHNSYVADFKYETDDQTGVNISDFIVRK